MNTEKEPITKFTKKMSNYFSIGVDARIGLGIQKKTIINAKNY